MLNVIRRFLCFYCLFAVLALLPAGKAASAEEAPTNWNVRCQEQGKSSCEIFQRLIVQETGQRMAEFAVGFPEDAKAARGVMVLPLGMLLPDGVQLQIDDHKPFQFKVRFCVQDGCFAYLSLNEAVLDMLRKGGKAVISFKTLQGQEIKIPMSLSGFTKSLEQIS